MERSRARGGDDEDRADDRGRTGRGFPSLLHSSIVLLPLPSLLLRRRCTPRQRSPRRCRTVGRGWMGGAAAVGGATDPWVI